MKDGSMEELGKILPRVLQKHVRGERAPVLPVLTGIWHRVAGKAMAAQARPLAFAAGTLTLAVRCPTWAAQLQGLREEIRRAVNQALGGPVVRQLRVRLENNQQASEAELAAKPREVRSLTLASQEADLASLAALDPELRAVVARSFTKYFARPDST
jgi:hypothetical protein